ncbi:MAG: RusA family crossover junction endodeoxyribonuclease [Flavobacterium sp.]|jgi:Holliday junction resolvase RusA-like endonuclease
MIKINIKPLSVNEAWQGRRFKTDKYKRYESDMLMILPNDLVILNDKPLSLFVEFGFSNNASDIDNCLKPMIDCLQKKYNFNDKLINELNVRKIKVSKGYEHIIFEIK